MALIEQKEDTEVRDSGREIVSVGFREDTLGEGWLMLVYA